LRAFARHFNHRKLTVCFNKLGHSKKLKIAKAAATRRCSSKTANARFQS
jgi:hypothetical protein